MGKATLKIFGNIIDILQGRVEPHLLRSIEPAHFRFALGGATSSDAHGIGETMVMNGKTYISWVQKGKLHEAAYPSPKSPFLMGVDQRQPFTVLMHYPIDCSLSLEQWYGELAEKYPMGFAILGSFQMDRFSSTYLKEAPIYHENVNEHQDKYWAHAEERLGAAVCLFGVVIPPLAKEKYSEKQLGHAFYHNPLDPHPTPFYSHTHGALLRQLVEAEEGETLMNKLGSASVEGIRHVLTQSVIRKGSFVLFPLNAVVVE